MITRTRLFAAAALAALLPIASASAAPVQVYNQSNPPDATDLPQGGWGSYIGFSVRFNDPNLSSTGTLPGTLLSELMVRHAGSNGQPPQSDIPGDDSAVLIKVYTTQNASAASWVGDSTNIADMSHGGAERNVSFVFDNLALSPETTYYFYFSNAAGDPNEGGFVDGWASGRLRVSNNANVTFGSGGLHDALPGTRFNSKDVAFDPVFVATFVPVPEPASLALMGVGGMMLLRRRRASTGV